MSQKIRKMGTAKKHCKTQDILIFWWSAAYLGAMLAHRGAMLAYLEGNVGPSWGYLGPSWGLCRLCWPILRPMLAHLEAHAGPCWPIATSSEKWENKRRALRDGPVLRATPPTAYRHFLNLQENYSCLTCLPVAKARTRGARHAETAGPWGTDRACGRRPPAPNVAFWTYKKTS